MSFSKLGIHMKIERWREKAAYICLYMYISYILFPRVTGKQKGNVIFIIRASFKR